MDPLYHLQFEHSCYPITGIDIFMEEKGWDYEKMKYNLSKKVVQHVKDHLNQVT